MQNVYLGQCLQFLTGASLCLKWSSGSQKCQSVDVCYLLR